MANNPSGRMSESELNARYTAASYKFASASDWRAYIELADEFRALDTYKDSAQKYSQCIKAASAPAYREVQAHLDALEEKTAADYREAARIMLLIQDYKDAREMARVYTVKANVMTYDAAVALVSNSEATTEEIGQGVEMFRSIKTFRNGRELLERYEKYYFERMYAEGQALMQNGHVWSEFDEAAEIFEKISTYGDAAEQAAACRKKANQMRPRRKRTDPEASPSGRAGTPDEDVTRVKVRRGKGRASPSPAGTPGETPTGAEQAVVKKEKKPRDETVNNVVEVWRTLDKRRLAVCLFWLAVLIADLIASVRIVILAQADPESWIGTHLNTLRLCCILLAILSSVLCVRQFLRMLTASMRRRLARAAAAFAKRLASPLVKMVTKLLSSIGIDLTRRNRLGGRDEKAFIYEDLSKAKKAKKRLKNEMKWAEQPDNAARVRFIFIDYMILRIRGGYFMRRTMTPAEIGRDMAVEKDEQELFRVYQVARYAPHDDANQDISDATVGRLRAINQRKGH